MIKITLPLVFFLLPFSYLCAQMAENEVTIVGQMKNVMWKGDLFGTIQLDTLSKKKGLYGFGPMEYLRGELLILDGITYKSTVIDQNNMLVEEVNQVKAPFFSYANIEKWEEWALPNEITDLVALEKYLFAIKDKYNPPFLFKLKGKVENALFHIVNLPEGTVVRSPNEAHVGKTNYEIKQQEVMLVGFFSTEHKTIFTHHDTFLHIHLITEDKTKMGHLDEIKIAKGSAILFLPVLKE